MTFSQSSESEFSFFFSTELAYCHFDGCNDDIPVK